MPAEPGLVVEDPDSGFCGAVVGWESGRVVLEDRHGTRRLFPLRRAGFLLEGSPVTLVRPPAAAAAPARKPQRSASGSTRVEGLRARTARASRIWVEGIHDAVLVERVWGHDLRVEGIVVEPLHGVDNLARRVAEFRPGPRRRLGVLVDHLVDGSKESQIVDTVNDPNVLVAGHPYVDIWQAVRPRSIGISGWPPIPKGVPWKERVCELFDWAARWRAGCGSTPGCAATGTSRRRCWARWRPSSTSSRNRAPKPSNPRVWPISNPTTDPARTGESRIRVLAGRPYDGYLSC